MFVVGSVRMRGSMAVRLHGGIDLDTDQIEAAVAHAAFGHDRFSKTPDSGARTAQDDAFDAMVVVQMGMQRGHGEIMMAVLQPGEPFGQFTLVMVVQVTQRGHTLPVCLAALAGCFQLAAQQVAHRFGAVAVAAFGNQRVESTGELLIQRNSDALHVSACSVVSPSQRELSTTDRLTRPTFGNA